MDLELKRIRVRKDTTDGLLRLHNRLICHTAEFTPKSLETGNYEVKMQLDTAQKSVLLLIIRSNGRKAVGKFIAGNGVFKARSGSIIVGDNVTWGLCIHSERRFNELTELFVECVKRNEKIFLEIV